MQFQGLQQYTCGWTTHQVFTASLSRRSLLLTMLTTALQAPKMCWMTFCTCTDNLPSAVSWLPSIGKCFAFKCFSEKVGDFGANQSRALIFVTFQWSSCLDSPESAPRLHHSLFPPYVPQASAVHGISARAFTRSTKTWLKMVQFSSTHEATKRAKSLEDLRNLVIPKEPQKTPKSRRRGSSFFFSKKFVLKICL